jgi:hypothetical protein
MITWHESLPRLQEMQTYWPQLGSIETINCNDACVKVLLMKKKTEVKYCAHENYQR